jgi:hypothetical protein
MTSFVLKLIAIISMLIDHTGDTFISLLGPKLMYFNTLGRFAFPLFCFMLVQGYYHTHNLKKYMLRLFIGGLLSQAQFMYFCHIFTGSYFHINVLFSLLFGLIALWIWDYKLFEKKEGIFYIVISWVIKISIITTLVAITSTLQFDYGAVAIPFILIIHIFFKKHKLIFAILYATLSYINYSFVSGFTGTPLIAYSIAAFLPIIFMFLYNGKKGPNTKYGLYFIYPVHLIILDLIYLIFLH